jgi:hypothetical protein
MKAFLRAAMMLALGAGMIQGCGGDDDGPTGPEVPADVMVIHASPDAPAVDVLIEGRTVLTGFSYPNNTNYEAEPSGNTNVRVNQAGTATALVQSDLPLQRNAFHSIFVTGMASGPSLWVIQDDLTHPPAGQARVRFVNVSPNAATMDMGFQGSGAMFTGIGFRGASAFSNVAIGGRTIEVREAGTSNVAASVGLNLIDQGVYTVMLRGLVGGSGGQALTASIIVNK